MIATELYKGQGLGNQLWCYATTRVIAQDHGYDFGVLHSEVFKGLEFMELDFGKPVIGIDKNYTEKSLIHPLNGSDIRLYDYDLVNVSDNTKLDGLMQDEQYIFHRKKEIKKWFHVKSEYDCRDYSSDNICIINFRGGGYVYDFDFFLPKQYWLNAIAHMRTINPKFKFVVVTDDVKTAKKFFPDFEVNHWNIGIDYSVIKNAHYLILSNSSFAFFPAWLSEDLKFCIAPKYWGRYTISDGYWSLGYNLVSEWSYLDRSGTIWNYKQCVNELKKYIENHKAIYLNSQPFKKTLRRSVENIFNKFFIIRKDSSTLYALIFLIQTNMLLLAIWLKNYLFKIYRKTRRQTRIILNLLDRFFRHVVWNFKEWRLKRTWLPFDKIISYRKTIKIYDVITFFNEIDLLEIRLNILDPYVDHFVIVEATQTFSGYSKPLYFRENIERFKKWESKIIYLVVEDLPTDENELKERLRKKTFLSNLDIQIIQNALISPVVGKDNNGRSISTWLREFYNKECIKRALINLKDNDFCYISDADEIWNPELLIDYSSDKIFKFRQIGYMYWLNNRTNEEDWIGWSGTIATKYKNIKNECLNHLRSHRLMARKYVFLRNGGWHFAFQGGFEGAKKKIEESRHFWYNPTETLNHLNERIIQNQHYRGQGFKLWKDENNLPKFLLNNKEKYKMFFK